MEKIKTKYLTIEKSQSDVVASENLVYGNSKKHSGRSVIIIELYASTVKRPRNNRVRKTRCLGIPRGNIFVDSLPPLQILFFIDRALNIPTLNHHCVRLTPIEMRGTS